MQQNDHLGLFGLWVKHEVARWSQVVLPTTMDLRWFKRIEFDRDIGKSRDYRGFVQTWAESTCIQLGRKHQHPIMGHLQ